MLTVGRDTGNPASDDYDSPATSHGGVVEKVRVAVKRPPPRDLAKEAEIARRRD